MICKFCGNSVSDGSQICNFCGSAIDIESCDCEGTVKELLGKVPSVYVNFEFENKCMKTLDTLNTNEILNRYIDSDTYTDKYRAVCYKVLTKRKDSLEILSKNPIVNSQINEANDSFVNCEYNEVFIENYGYPPRCNSNYINEDWTLEISELENNVLLERYDDEEQYNDNYRFICYKEIENRFKKGLI